MPNISDNQFANIARTSLLPRSLPPRRRSRRRGLLTKTKILQRLALRYPRVAPLTSRCSIPYPKENYRLQSSKPTNCHPKIEEAQASFK